MQEFSLPPRSIVPRYGSYCISGIPSTIMGILGAKPVGERLPDDAFGSVDVNGIDNVVLLILDGFGMSAWRRQQREGFVKAMSENGNVRPITTVFPSTTAAALTTFATGLTPQQHGLPEWFVYMKDLDAVVATLPFSFAKDSGRETLRGHMKARALFSGEPIFRKLREAGVQAHSFVSRALAGTSFTSFVHRDSDKVAYSGASDMATHLRRRIEAARRPSFFHVYWSYIDTIEHRYGPRTDESELEATSISFVLRRGLLDKLDRRAAKRTLLVASADHGQVRVSPEKTLYLNRYRTLVRSLKRMKTGAPIPATGSARDVFLHVQKDKEDEVKRFLTQRLAGRSSVVRIRDAMERGLFGLGRPSRKFTDRAGSLLLLPYGNGTIWYRDRPDYEFDLRGHHGGLSKEEMTVPLAVGRLSDLQR
ncbi:MAG: alkaline phosphatase family protein [Nitrososphaerales archaeon]|nr:alkaline phosphatase family protein [Nitrososphaerales archaeon]